MGNKAVSSLLLQTSYITQVGGGGASGEREATGSLSSLHALCYRRFFNLCFEVAFT